MNASRTTPIIPQDFIEPSEWPLIISECDPGFVPSEAEPTGKLQKVLYFTTKKVVALVKC